MAGYSLLTNDVSVAQLHMKMGTHGYPWILKKGGVTVLNMDSIHYVIDRLRHNEYMASSMGTQFHMKLGRRELCRCCLILWYFTTLIPHRRC